MRCRTFGSDRCVVSTAHGNSPRSIPAIHFDSPKTISAAAPRPPEPPRRDDDGSEEEWEDDEDECEFALVLTDPENGEEKTTADEIFSDGRIRTLYPADGRAYRERVRRMSGKDQQRVSSLDSTSSSEVNELERVAPGTYCAWEPRKPKAPPQGRCKKSSSTGSLRPWRIRDLVKRRSQSDGKEKFVFLSAEQKRGCSPRNPRRDSAEAGTIKDDDSGEEEEGKEEGGKPRRRGRVGYRNRPLGVLWQRQQAGGETRRQAAIIAVQTKKIARQ
ncbi:hypothetical protein GW17_00038212 [Ensete ventricosum]|nr:hypothetical protein GW17_00038212 [Ensete ventricosum]